MANLPWKSSGFLRSMRGNTLVGLLAGLAIVEISGTALVTAMGQFSQQQSQLDLKTASSALGAEMADEFDKLATCTAAINTTNKLQQESDGSWPISMSVPSLPNQLLNSGNSTPLGTTGLHVNRLYLDRLSDTGLLGTNNKKLYTGNVIVSLASNNDGAMAMRSQMVSQLFVEIGDDGRIVSCASGNDPTLALNFACARVGGKIVNGLCSMDDWGKAQVARAVGEYYQSVRADYFNQIHAETSRRIQVAADQTFRDSVGYSNGQMDLVSNELNGTISSRDLASNTNLGIVNNTLDQNIRDLQSQINATNALTSQAQAVTTAANQSTAAANAATGSANAHSASAQAYLDQASWISNQAVATASQANAVAANANAVANQANNTSNAANGVTNTANYYTNAANGASNAANATSGWASNAASSANNYSTSAINAANAANNASSSAINASYAANNASNAAMNAANASYGQSSTADYWYNAWAGRQGYATYSYSYSSRGCTVGGPNCMWQQ